MLYNFCRGLLRGLYRLLFRLEAIGVEHVPTEGGVLLCSNHVSLFDPPTVGVLLERKVHFMAKQELFKIPLFGKLIHELGAFPVKRGGVSKESIKISLNILRDGKVMGIFPEGSRHSEGEGKKGAASFALRSGAAVVPVAIIGNYRLFSKVKVVYGTPIDMTPFQEDPKTAVDTLTDEIMKQIEQLKHQYR